MKVKEGSPTKRTIHIPPAPIHIFERDQADLARFRAAMARLTERQQAEVISRVEMQDTP